MARFVAIAYGDRDGYDRVDAAVRDAAHAQDAKLRARGATIGMAGPAVQVRNPEQAGVTTANGPFMSSSLPVAGFTLLDADSLEDAIELMSTTPCAVAYGVVEVWPLDELG